MDEFLALVMHSRNLDGLAQFERALFGNAIVGTVTHNHGRHVLRQLEQMILDIGLGGLAHRGVGPDGLAQIVKALGDAIGANRPACLSTVNAKEHQVLDERLDAQGHKVHRLDAHAVVENDIGMILNGSLDVCRQRNRGHIVRAHKIERRDCVGRVTDTCICSASCR